MVKARSNAIACTVWLGLLLMLRCEAVTYIVGGDSGWTYGVETWPHGKIFKADDTLVFHYSPSKHNVVVASKKEYSSCKISKKSKVYQTGHDRIKLKKGPNYFVCSVKGKCDSGVKIFVHAK